MSQVREGKGFSISQHQRSPCFHWLSEWLPQQPVWAQETGGDVDLDLGSAGLLLCHWPNAGFSVSEGSSHGHLVPGQNIMEMKLYGRGDLFMANQEAEGATRQAQMVSKGPPPEVFL